MGCRRAAGYGRRACPELSSGTCRVCMCASSSILMTASPVHCLGLSSALLPVLSAQSAQTVRESQRPGWQHPSAVATSTAIQAVHAPQRPRSAELCRGLESDTEMPWYRSCSRPAVTSKVRLNAGMRPLGMGATPDTVLAFPSRAHTPICQPPCAQRAIICMHSLMLPARRAPARRPFVRSVNPALDLFWPFPDSVRVASDGPNSHAANLSLLFFLGSSSRPCRARPVANPRMSHTRRAHARTHVILTFIYIACASRPPKVKFWARTLLFRVHILSLHLRYPASSYLRRQFRRGHLETGDRER